MVATCLGKACLSASVPPQDGLFLFEELERARKSIVLETELHQIYLVTPFNASSLISQIDWTIFLDIWRALPESERCVGRLVGVDEKRFLLPAMRGIVKSGKVVSFFNQISYITFIMIGFFFLRFLIKIFFFITVKYSSKILHRFGVT